MARKPRAGRYTGDIQVIPLHINNASREAFRTQLEAVPFLGYQVETLADGRRICITKPGGKNAFGHMKIHDFMVWIYDATTHDRWRISHREIAEDVEAKIQADRAEGERVVKALMRVYHGEEPDAVLASAPELGQGLPGESPEVILKVYKWIWGQEDCNYPTGEGRCMSMKEIERISGLKADDLVAK